MFNLANNLTLARVGAVPILVLLLYFPSRGACFAAMMVFIAAAVTDIMDGVVARRCNLVTNFGQFLAGALRNPSAIFGKFLDPLAEKLLISAALIMLVQLGWAEAWVAVVIVGREIAVTGLRAMAVDHGVVIAADRYGKLKTVLQMVALCPLLLHYPFWGFDPAPLGQTLVYLALVLTLVSGVNYFYGFSKQAKWSDKAAR